MRQLAFELTRAVAREYHARGMPLEQAARQAALDTQTIISRYEAGWPEESLTVGMAGFFKKIFKAVSKPFKKIAKEAERVGKKIEKNIVRPVAKEVERAGHKIEQKIIRPIARWEYLSYIAAAIPGVGVYASAAISAAQAAREIYVARKDSKDALRNYEQAVNTAYGVYLSEAAQAGVLPISRGEFEAYMTAGPVQGTF